VDPGVVSAAPDIAPVTGATDTATRWVGVLFAIGSACFLVGPLPGFVELVGSEVDAAVFFAGSVFFTSAALLQMLHSGGGLDRWACVVQFAGTLFFNVSTFHGGPDWRGSICFLVSGVLAYLAVRRLSHGRWIGGSP
jgi:hypothetical protein